MQYFIKRGEKVQGPFSREQLMSFIKAKKLTDSDLVAIDELGPFGELKSMWDSIGGTTNAPKTENSNSIACGSCGEPVFKSATTCPKCASPIGSAQEATYAQLQDPVAAAMPTPVVVPETANLPSVNPNLTACPDCGATISKKALACPQCGSPMAQQQDHLAPQTTMQQPEQKTNSENVSENASKVKEDLKAFGNKTLEVTGAVAEKVGTQAKQLKDETAEIYNQQGMKAAGKHLAKSFLSNKLFLIIGIVAACFAVIFFCGISWLFFGDSHGKVLEDYISEMKQLSAIVGSIESIDDVDAAERRIAKRLKNIQQIKERGNKLKKPDSEKAKKLRDKYEGRINEQVDNLLKATLKVGRSSGPATKKILEKLKGISSSFNFY